VLPLRRNPKRKLSFARLFVPRKFIPVGVAGGGDMMSGDNKAPQLLLLIVVQ
jgi:hypothetical protein